MATTIKLKNSVTTTNAPTSLVQGEVAINITDKKVWVGNAATTPVLLLGSGADGTFTNLTVSGVASFADGTVSLPSITNIGDTNTGIYFPAADTIAFTEGGTESMRIDSAGNLGVGTSSPNAASRATILSSGTSTSAFGNVGLRLSANGSGYASTLVFSDEVANSAGISMVSGNLAFGTSGFNTERMRIDSSGNVGIGTTTPNKISGTTILSINTASPALYAGLDISTNDAVRTALYANNAGSFLETRTSTPLVFGTNTTERMRIDSSGNVGIGTSTPSSGSKLTVAVNTTGATVPTDSLVAIVDSKDMALGDGGGIRMGGVFTTGSTSNPDMTYIKAYKENATSGNFSYALTFGTRANGGNPTEQMRIDSSGNLLVGATATSGNAKFFVDGSVTDNISRMFNSSATPYGLYIRYSGAAPNNTGQEFLFCNDTGATRFTARSNGGLANYSANNVNLSDAREKTNIELAGNYLSKICSIPVKTFNYIDQNRKDDDGLTLGVVAQDVQAVAPELVSESDWSAEKDGSKMRLSIYQTDLQYALMKAIQELKAELDSVKAELQTLKGN